MLFWLIVLIITGGLVLFFFDAIRQNPLSSMFFILVGVFFVWRVFGFLSGADDNDPLIWKIIGATVALMVVVGLVGKCVEHLRGRK